MKHFILTFIFFFSISTELLAQILNVENFCDEMLRKTGQEREKFININYQSVIENSNTRAINLVVTLGVSMVDVAFGKVIKQSSETVEKYTNIYATHYNNNTILRTDLLTKLDSSKDKQSCVDTFGREMSEKFKIFKNLDDNSNLLEIRAWKANEIQQKNRKSKEEFNNAKCDSEITIGTCNDPIQSIPADEGFNQLIKTVSPASMPGGFDKFCDCSRSQDVGKAFWHYEDNKNMGENAKRIIRKELANKKFFALLDYNEKKSFVKPTGATTPSTRLGCGDTSISNQVQELCKKSGKVADTALLQELMVNFLNKNPRSSSTPDSLDLLEEAIVKTQNKSTKCPGMQYDNYAYLVDKDLFANLERFGKVFSLVLSEVDTIDFKQSGDDRFEKIYDIGLQKIMKDELKLNLLKTSLGLDKTSTQADVIKQFQLLKMNASQNLGLKLIMNNPEKIKEQMQQKPADFDKMYSSIKSSFVSDDKCHDVTNEFANVICGNDQYFDADKYDISIDDLVKNRENKITQDELTGLCLQRRASRKNEKIESALFTSLPIENRPDIISYYDPAYKNNPSLTANVHDSYSKNFCKELSLVQSCFGSEQDLIQRILQDPNSFSQYGDFSSLFGVSDSPGQNRVRGFNISEDNDGFQEQIVVINNKSFERSGSVLAVPNKSLNFTNDFTSSSNTRLATPATSASTELDQSEEKPSVVEIVKKYKDLDDDDEDYFEKRKELLKQLYSQSENSSMNSNQEEYLARIKNLENQLKQKENQLQDLSHSSSNSLNIQNPDMQTAYSPSSASLAANSNGAANQVEPSSNTGQTNSANTSSSPSRAIAGSLNGSDSVATPTRSRSDALYLNVTPADFNNPDFVKSLEKQIKLLIETDFDQLAQQLEAGPVVVDVQGKKVGVQIEDLKKILDAKTLEKLKSKMNKLKKKDFVEQKKEVLKDEISIIKSEMYQNLLLLSKSLKARP